MEITSIHFIRNLQNSMVIKKGDTSGIYIHFPYCIHKCAYCDFYSVPNSIKENYDIVFPLYYKEIEQRIQEDSEILNLKYDSIFIGGGTPSLANPKLLDELLKNLRNKFTIFPDSEISIEVNPESISKEKLDWYYDMGINRVNVGIQSLQPILLKNLDRYFSDFKYNSVLEILENSKIKNFGFDLMYGIPEQTYEQFLEDLKKLISINPKHLSVYSLTAEKGTKYFQDIQTKRATSPNEDLQVRILQELPDFLRTYNYSQYEVSNYSKFGKECRHNLKYWTFQYYLGIGPSASGFVPKGRYSNKRSIESYLKGNFSSEYELPDYLNETAISLFRIFYPIEIDPFLDKIQLDKKIIYQLFEKWSKNRICQFDGKIFQWEKESILRLEEFILEFASLEDRS